MAPTHDHDEEGGGDGQQPLPPVSKKTQPSGLPQSPLDGDSRPAILAPKKGPRVALFAIGAVGVGAILAVAGIAGWAYWRRQHERRGHRVLGQSEVHEGNAKGNGNGSIKRTFSFANADAHTMSNRYVSDIEMLIPAQGK